MTGLTVHELTVRFGSRAAVDDVSLQVPAGQITAVLGPSGCGKSTLLRAIAGLEALDSGSVRFEDGEVTHTPVHRRGFALMFQDGQLFEHRTVEQNVGYALHRLPRAERRSRVRELLALVELDGDQARRPAELSGGERQRVALARALAAQPRLLLLDEPLSALDRDLRERLAPDLRRILQQVEATAIVVTHDHDEAFALADQLVLMRQGGVVQSGDPSQVWAAPVDPDAARFIGYAAVVDADQQRKLGVETGPPDALLALRRSALVVAPQGSIEGTVLSWRGSPEQLRLRVAVAGMDGVLDAVARTSDAATLAPGAAVRLRLDLDRTAWVSAPVQGSQSH